MPEKIFRIKGAVQHYSWGGYDFIPNLLGIKNDVQKPFAEYWLGAHPNHSSKMESTGEFLHDFIKSHPNVLGESVRQKFGSLPFLFKILDVRQMLSIQVHPAKEVAAQEYARENASGIPLTAAHRNYKDQNHKPELMVALDDFWLLHGFKKEEELKRTLASIPHFSSLLQLFQDKGYKGLYEEVMRLSPGSVNSLLKPVIERIIPLYQNQEFRKEEEDFWAARAAIEFCKDGNYDRGIFSIYFFNLVHLKKGQGIYQPQGMPHAYLEGKNVEVMANSDNVLRAGLTDKHIDVPELLRHVHFEATDPAIIEPLPGTHRVFSSPADEFELQEYQIGKNGQHVQTASAEIWLLLAGMARVQSEGHNWELKQGEAIFVAADTNLSIDSSEEGRLFRVRVPL